MCFESKLVTLKYPMRGHNCKYVFNDEGEELLQELHQIIKEDYGKDLKKQEISEIAYSLLGFFDLLAKINHRKQLKNKDNEEEKSR